MRRTLALVLALALLGLVVPAALAGPAAGERQAPDAWSTKVFATVGKPGFPAYVHVAPNGRVYAATYSNPMGDAMASRIFEWTTNGTLLRSWTVPDQDLGVAHGVQVATSDARGRLVLLEKSRAQVLTLNLRTGRFKVQATLPDLPGGGKPIPNYAAWGPRGKLYLTDYGQGVIWRIRAKGGQPKPWFQSKALEGLEFGTTGIVYQRSSRSFLISQQTTTDPLDLLRGHLYRLPVQRGGAPGEISTVWTSGPLDLPDGFGVAQSGNIYLSLLGTNQLVKLSPDGKELGKFPPAPVHGSNGSKIPFDSPSNATFLGNRVLVANQSAIFGMAANHAVLAVDVGEPGAPIFIPKRARLR